VKDPQRTHGNEGNEKEHGHPRDLGVGVNQVRESLEEKRSRGLIFQSCVQISQGQVLKDDHQVGALEKHNVEPPVVLPGDAVGDPVAVMVKTVGANSAIATMFGTWRFDNLARPAIL